MLEESPAATVVPRESIVEDETGISVFLVKNNIAKKISVRRGLESKGLIEVIGDLEEGDSVVVFGKENLKDGVKVLVK